MDPLKKAIKAASLAGTAERAAVIVEARDANLAALIPADWQDDGTLTVHPRFSERADGRTYDDTRQLVQAAIYDTLPRAVAEDCYVCIVDMTDDWAVYQLDWCGDLLQVNYAIDADGAVTLEPAVTVAETTTYTPIEAKATALVKAQPRSVALPRVKEWCWPLDASPQIRMDAAEDGAPAQVANFLGWASTTDSGYDVHDWLGTYVETIRSGAFAKSLRETPNVMMFFDHDGVPLASTGADTSRLSEDKQGLRNEADWDLRSPYSNGIAISVQRGDLSKMSFSFAAMQDDWTADYSARTVTELRLYDTSVVSFPANPETSAMLRSEMRSALGREGMALMVATRSITDVMAEVRTGQLPDSAEPIFEQSLTALLAADDHVAKVLGPYCRARTRAVELAILSAREGKTLSGANEKLLRQALASLTDAGESVTEVLGDPETADAAPADPPESGDTSNPTAPDDGAGARALEIERERVRVQLELLRRKRHRAA